MSRNVPAEQNLFLEWLAGWATGSSRPTADFVFKPDCRIVVKTLGELEWDFLFLEPSRWSRINWLGQPGSYLSFYTSRGLAIVSSRPGNDLQLIVPCHTRG